MQLAPVCYTVHVSWTLNLNGYSESSTCFIHVNLVSKINAIPVSPCFMGLVAQILATSVFLFSLERFTLIFFIIIIIAKGRVHNLFTSLFNLHNMLLLS